MAHITIRNIGPIKEVDIDLNKINVFMGAQSSGKSTIAKIICHCQWVEKKCFPTVDKTRMMNKYAKNFYDYLVEHHRLVGYFDTNSTIEYSGDFVLIQYTHTDKKATITENPNAKYSYPKIAYIPSERNLLAAIPTLTKYNDTDDYILDFMYDWFSAREIIKNMPLNNVLQSDVKYSFSNNRDYIMDGGKKILLSNTSSGVQSLTPMMMVLQNSIETIYKNGRTRSYEEELELVEMTTLLYHKAQLTPEKIKIFEDIRDSSKLGSTDLSKYNEIKKIINSTFNYNYSRIFLEEPEQNLFPNTQIKFIYWLMGKLRRKKHLLTLTTHSPYILFALNNCMMGGLVDLAIPKNQRLGFDSSTAWLNPKNVSIYEIENGTLRCIQDNDGIIEDNYLNEAYKEVSAEYLSLLEYYDEDDDEK